MRQIGPAMRLVLVVASLAGMALVAARLGRRGERPEAIEGMRAIAEGRAGEAAAAASRWLAAEPRAAGGHVLRGRVDVAEDRLPEAADELRSAMAMGGEPGDLALLRALIAAKAGRHAEAIPSLERASSGAHRADRQVAEALARAYLETYDLNRAAIVLDRWARDFPDDPKPHLWRAEVHGRDGSETGVVEADFREALRREASLAPSTTAAAVAGSVAADLAKVDHHRPTGGDHAAAGSHGDHRTDHRGEIHGGHHRERETE
ncbi:hypothetical protein OJF2_65310 [Aquisphaera giovannonii]|uniref:Tetratricopeptide repeat protein n=1 Tax=Aquisphaera giovannonii TaxID=406548 RepID=A0A5B9WCZ4_9BACT|nr:tetratricopeptide repeat protein [Aquisphaera giovannonii]QEH37935.1 hypothetical protein OJF2_65310 [Aquisphaera giovannonii]